MTNLRSYNGTMNNDFSKETRSYQDPAAQRIEAAAQRREALEAEFPRVSAVYDGFYLQLEELSDEGNRFFLGAEAIVGSKLCYEGKTRETAQLLSGDGRVLAQITGAAAERLAAYASADWHLEPLISAIFFRAQGKRATAELAFICWAPLSAEHSTALAAFCRNIADRIASGDRAELKLSQKQFISVLRSNGAWYLTPATKREPLQKGTIVYKNRRSGTERIAAYALGHRRGCSVLASLFWLALAAGIVYLVWSFFFAP